MVETQQFLKMLLEEGMRNSKMALIAMVATLSCLSLVAVGQVKSEKQTTPKVTDKILAMRKTADTIAKAIAKAAQSHAVKAGKYDNYMTHYEADFGGKLPINPCTGTRTGYTMTVSEDGKESAIAATEGKNCGTWTPKVYRLTLKH